MEGMFKYCGSLTIIDLSSFDISHTDNMKDMFYEDKKLQTIYKWYKDDYSWFRNEYGAFYHCHAQLEEKSKK
jgi:surface protein